MEDKEAWTTIFQSGDKFYLWERIGDDVYEIVSRDISEITSMISRSQFGELAKKPVNRIMYIPYSDSEGQHRN